MRDQSPLVWLVLGLAGFIVLAFAGQRLIGSSDDDDRATTTTTAVASFPGNKEAPAEPGEPPTRAPVRTAGVAPRPPLPTVLASGRTARGNPFELVIWGTEKGTCITLELPFGNGQGGRPTGGAGGCSEDGSVLPAIDRPIQAWGSSSGYPGTAVRGFTQSRTAAVELSFEHDGETETLAAAVEEIPARLLRQAGAQANELGIFVAFLPPGVAAEAVTATAYGADGDELGTTSWPTFFE